MCEDLSIVMFYRSNISNIYKNVALCSTRVQYIQFIYFFSTDMCRKKFMEEGTLTNQRKKTNNENPLHCICFYQKRT